MDEVFKVIKEFPDYKVSNYGYLINMKGQKLKTGKATGGYLIVFPYKDGKRYCKKLHRLVAEAFVPNPDALPQVNHKDEDVTNNKADNLEWCTAKYNSNYGTRNERIKRRNTGRKHTEIAIDNMRQNNTRKKQVCQYTLDGKLVKVWDSMMDAEREGFSQAKISLCCNGKRKTSNGFRWEYTKNGG